MAFRFLGGGENNFEKINKTNKLLIYKSKLEESLCLQIYAFSVIQRTIKETSIGRIPIMLLKFLCHKYKLFSHKLCNTNYMKTFL